MKKTKLWRLRRAIQKPFEKERFRLYIDVSSCNLRCVMCPRGGANGLINEGKGLMDFNLFKEIIDKFVKEKVSIDEIGIGNWGEPLLNPALPKMINYAVNTLQPVFMESKGKIKIGTNLNYLTDPIELLESGVTDILFSTSGMTQDVYSRNHKGGKADVVLKNIMQLVDIKRKRNIENVSLEMIFHDYIYNKEDAEKAKIFCEDNGIKFNHRRIYICSVEDNVKFQKEKERVVKLYEGFIDLAGEEKLQKTIKNVKKCHLRRHVITINYDGQLYRCAGVFEQKYFMGHFSDYKIKNIWKIRSAICDVCAKTPISFR